MYKICPKCGMIAEYNSYYGRFTCTRCTWEGNYTNEHLKKVYKLLNKQDVMNLFMNFNKKEKLSSR